MPECGTSGLPNRPVANYCRRGGAAANRRSPFARLASCQIVRGVDRSCCGEMDPSQFPHGSPPAIASSLDATFCRYPPRLPHLYRSLTTGSHGPSRVSLQPVAPIRAVRHAAAARGETTINTQKFAANRPTWGAPPKLERPVMSSRKHTVSVESIKSRILFAVTARSFRWGTCGSSVITSTTTSPSARRGRKILVNGGAVAIRAARLPWPIRPASASSDRAATIRSRSAKSMARCRRRSSSAARAMTCSPAAAATTRSSARPERHPARQRRIRFPVRRQRKRHADRRRRR